MGNLSFIVDSEENVSINMSGLSIVQAGICVGDLLYALHEAQNMSKEEVFQAFIFAMNRGYDARTETDAETVIVEDCQA
jgi:hypothetical protein